MTSNHESIGQRAEDKVTTALKKLPSHWQHFATVEWRTLRNEGEAVGEADVVVFHPGYGLVIFEIKAGAVDIRGGTWYYASGQMMKQSPFSQARRNRFALMAKLEQRLGKGTVEALTITHAVWFPDVQWTVPLPGTEAPSKAFLFDKSTLEDPEPALLRLFRQASTSSIAWSSKQQQILKELLAPDCHLLVPLAVQVDDANYALHLATEQQMVVLRALRAQSRLLVEGSAGSGKTVLACTLAREHAALGKSVLLTCFNRHLVNHLACCLEDIANIHVINFHELVKQHAEAVGLPYVVPQDPAERAYFFKESAPEILLNAVEFSDMRYDSIIVDEATDFSPTWWIALEALGRQDFSWYCFYDRRQTLYQSEQDWQPPFSAAPIVLDINLRNPKPIGVLAATLGHCVVPVQFRVEDGKPPVILKSDSFAGNAIQLRQLLKELLLKEHILPEQIVILAPYRHTNPQSNWSAGLDLVELSTDLATPQQGKVRIGTLQAFKGLEADIVILVGIDLPAGRHPEWLYVGASRARGALYILALENAGI